MVIKGAEEAASLCEVAKAANALIAKRVNNFLRTLLPGPNYLIRRWRATG